jgi:hypothetical protein
MSQTQVRRPAEPIRRRVDDELLTAQELADYLKIPLATIYKQRREGTGVPKATDWEASPVPAQ